jgi:broad specificity phosphatase PhoE
MTAMPYVKSRLVLVRHSLPEMDFAVSSHEWRLSDEGRRRCEKLADALVDYAPIAVVSSGEPKAAETAEIVATRFGLQVEIEPDLHEHDRHGVGRLSGEVFQDAISRLFDEPDVLAFGNETGRQALERFARAIDRVLARSPESDVVIVSHGTVISLFVAACAGIDGHALWQRLGLPCFIVLSLPDLALEKVIPNVSV